LHGIYKSKKRLAMKYRIFIIALFLGWIVSCEKEISPVQSEKFIKFYGNYLMDEAGDVAALDDGGYAICGTGTVPNGGKRVIFIITDEYGNLKPGFPRYYTEGNLESGANALVVKDGGQGGYLLCGYLERPVSGSGQVQKDMFLVRTNSSGEELWQQSYGTSLNEVILHASERVNSGYILAGYRENNGKKGILIVGVKPEQDTTDILELSYYNSNSENSSANFIEKTGDRYLCVCTYDKPADTGTNILILNMDDNLGALPIPFSGSFNESGKCMISDNTGNYLVLGNRVNSSGRSEVVVYLVEVETVYPYSVTGDIVATVSESNANLTAERFVRTENGSIAIVGTRNDGSTKDIFLQFLSADYSVGELIIYGSAGDQSGTDIDIPSGGGIVLLGDNSKDNNSMISLIKTGDDGNL